MNIADFDNEPNGHKIVMCRMFYAPRGSAGRSGRVVLAQAPEGRAHNYVVAIQYPGEEGWNGGQYMQYFDKAVDAYNRRGPKLDINPGLNFKHIPARAWGQENV